MKFIFFTFDGCGLPIAYHLKNEGYEVLIGQVQDGKDLGVDSWNKDEETPEQKKRRLSLYDGILKKYTDTQLFSMMKDLPDKQDYFVIFDYNIMCRYAEKAIAMGFTKGLFPLEEDFNAEKDREAAKEKVKKYYPGLTLAEEFETKSVKDAIMFIQSKPDKTWVVKSMGNIVDTYIPNAEKVEDSNNQVIAALEKEKQGYEKGGFILEEKIENFIEMTPQLSFWDGKPIYSIVEIETKWLGSGNIGPQTGGSENLIIKTPLNCKLNEISFPPIVYQDAKKRKGLYNADAGLLYKGGKFYFTEFAGNRWSWGGAYSEFAMASKKMKMGDYFEKVASGKNPHDFNSAVTLTLYNLLPDKENLGLYKDGNLIDWDKEIDSYFSPIQVRKEKDNMVIVGGKETTLGYLSCGGNSPEEAVSSVYKKVSKVRFKDKYYRPEFDFLSKDYADSQMNRYEVVKKFIKENIEKEIFGYDFDGVVSEGIQPKKDGIIITGRTKDMAKETREEMKKMGMPKVPISFYPKDDLKVDENARNKQIADHKARVINKKGVVKFFEDTPLEAEIIKKKTNAQVVEVKS